MKSALRQVDTISARDDRATGPRRFKPIQSVTRASSVLKAFGEARGELGIGELAARVQLSPSTVYRLVGTLVDAGLLERNESTGKYYPGLDLFILAQTAIPQQTIARESGAALEMLAQTIGEAASLGCLQGDRVVLLRHVDVATVLRVDLQSGDTLPAESSALGQAILAFRGEAVLPLPAEMARVRPAGFAVDWGECIPGVASVAAPIRDFHGEVVAALAVSGPTARLTEDKLVSVGPRVIEAAELVSRRLGWERQRYRDPPD